MLLFERIKTSLILPKIIFGATVFLFIFAAAIGYVMITAEPSTIINEAASISDEIEATITRGG